MIKQLTQAIDQAEAAQARLERPLSQLLAAENQSPRVAAASDLPFLEALRVARDIDRVLVQLAASSTHRLPEPILDRIARAQRRQVAVWSDIRELAHGALAEVELTQTVAMQDDDEHPANRFADAAEAGQLLERVTVAMFGHFSELDDRIEQLEDRQAEVWSAVAVGTA